jgi:hypothetical protein
MQGRRERRERRQNDEGVYIQSLHQQVHKDLLRLAQTQQKRQRLPERQSARQVLPERQTTPARAPERQTKGRWKPRPGFEPAADQNITTCYPTVP